MTDPIEEMLLNFKQGRTSDFCSKTVTVVDDFQIQVTDVGNLRLPLKPSLIKSLIKQARPAKYGLKEKTLLDKNVRDVWEIPKSRIKINRRLWKKSFDATLLQLKISLGLSERSKLKAELHNLVIYEPGQFFKPHQDSEKCDSMIATLVVLLPSYYRGGTLIVDHQGNKKRFTSRNTPEDKLTFIAFYADCHHEVRPVTDGYRVALTYNLVLESGEDVNESLADGASEELLTNALNDYFESDQSNGSQNLPAGRTKCKKFAYLLDHEYTAKGLDWSRLKNSDRTRVNTLRDIAEKLNMETHLSLIEIHESWECQDDSDWSHSRRHRYWEYEDEIEVEKKSNNEYTLGEMLFSEIEFKHSLDTQGKKVNMSGLLIRENEIFRTKETEEFTPFESEYEGYMGNWGNTMDHWYHRAAIILWRKVDHYLMLLERGPTVFLNAVSPLAKKKKERENVQRIINHILPNWQGLRDEDDLRNVSRVLKLALTIENPEHATQLVKALRKNALCKETTNELIALAKAHGPTWCTQNMQTWLSTQYETRDKHILVDSLFPIIKNLIAEKSNISFELASWLVQHQLDAFIKVFDSNAKTYHQAELDEDVSQRVTLLTNLMEASLVAERFLAYEELVSYTIQNKNLFPVVELSPVLLKTVRYSQKLTSAQQQYQQLKDHVLREINTALNGKPRSANDWSIKDVNRCDCDDCQVFNQFLLDSLKQKLIWPMAKARRQHIHQVVARMKLPMTHTTERTGSPHRLHLTKTKQLFTREEVLRDKYTKALESLNEHG